LRLGHVGMGEIASRNRTEPCLLLLFHTAAAVSRRIGVRGGGSEPFRRALVCFRPSGPDALALDRGRSESGRGNIQLLGQLREVGQSEWRGPSAMAGIF